MYFEDVVILCYETNAGTVARGTPSSAGTVAGGMPNSDGTMAWWHRVTWGGQALCHGSQQSYNAATAMQPSLMSGTSSESKPVPLCHRAIHLVIVITKRYKITDEGQHHNIRAIVPMCHAFCHDDNQVGTNSTDLGDEGQCYDNHARPCICHNDSQEGTSTDQLTRGNPTRTMPLQLSNAGTYCKNTCRHS